METEHLANGMWEQSRDNKVSLKMLFKCFTTPRHGQGLDKTFNRGCHQSNCGMFWIRRYCLLFFLKENSTSSGANDFSKSILMLKFSTRSKSSCLPCFSTATQVPGLLPGLTHLLCILKLLSGAGPLDPRLTMLSSARKGSKRTTSHSSQGRQIYHCILTTHFSVFLSNQSTARIWQDSNALRPNMTHKTSWGWRVAGRFLSLNSLFLVSNIF